MIVDIHEFWEVFSRIVASVTDPLSSADGVTKNKVVKAEELLGFEFPELLREYYLRTANRKDINRYMNRLISLDKLSIDQDRLVFFEENQVVSVWGIALSDLISPNPMVWASINTDVLDWYEFSVLSDFLIAQLFWTCANGAAEYIVSRDIDGSLIETPKGWRHFGQIGSSGLQALWRDGQLLIIVGNKEVVGCARTAEDLSAIEEQFGLEFE